ncbi:lysine exporter LysO family protein [Psychrilyobacter sp.]|uniref:lysine exporter LysO family protein n=1 Tax=Psychrilyobacter sp. TaxID=2586924 RepID=UPI0030171495
MTLSIIFSVLTGILGGYFFITESLTPYIDILIDSALYFLMLCVGIDIGLNKHIFKDLKKHSLIILVVPTSIIVGSLLGGLLTGYIFDMPKNLSLAISSGFGWYSLSGIILTQLDGAEIGTIAFLTNVFRELITVISIPFIAKYLNDYTTIAPAGATSMDSTLPIISKHTNPETVVIAFINGILLMGLVPILVPFFYSL